MKKPPPLLGAKASTSRYHPNLSTNSCCHHKDSIRLKAELPELTQARFERLTEIRGSYLTLHAGDGFGYWHSPQQLQGEFVISFHRFAAYTGSLQKRKLTTTPLHSFLKFE